MRTIGLLGGMSWESTVTYYQMLNTMVRERLGGLHSAKCLLYSVDFQEIEACQASGQWEKSGEILLAGAQGLERAGADFILICTNTMHKVAPQIQRGLTIPLLHIAQVTADTLLAQGIRTVGLLGTRYTMEQDFYKSVLVERGIQVLVPDEVGRAEVDRIIFSELCLGQLAAGSRQTMLDAIAHLAQDGAQGVILGCTEIGLLVRQADTPVPLFDTTELHAGAAVEKALY